MDINQLFTMDFLLLDRSYCKVHADVHGRTSKDLKREEKKKNLLLEITNYVHGNKT